MGGLKPSAKAQLDAAIRKVKRDKKKLAEIREATTEGKATRGDVRRMKRLLRAARRKIRRMKRKERRASNKLSKARDLRAKDRAKAMKAAMPKTTFDSKDGRVIVHIHM